MKPPVGALTALLAVALAGGAVALVRPEIGTLVLLTAPLLAVSVELASLRRRGLEHPPARRWGVR